MSEETEERVRIRDYLMVSRKYCLNIEILFRKIAIHGKFREHVISQKFRGFLIREI